MVVDEIIIPITDITLVNGMVRFTAEKRGPAPAVTAANYVIFDQEGRVVFKSIEGEAGRLSWGAVHPGTKLVVYADVVIEGRIARAR